MAIAGQPLDANGVPVSSSYVPSSVPVAIQGSLRTNTDALSNTYTAPIFEQRTVEDIRSGFVYSATTGKLVTSTNANLTEGASLFNPAASGRSILVLSARCLQSAGTGNPMQLNITTVDPQLGAPTALTIVNLQAGGAASTLAGLSPVPVTSAANNATASIAVTGTLFDVTLVASPAWYEFIPAGMGILLPKGTAAGVLLSTLIAVAGTTTYICSFKWVEATV